MHEDSGLTLKQSFFLVSHGITSGQLHVVVKLENSQNKNKLSTSGNNGQPPLLRLACIMNCKKTQPVRPSPCITTGKPAACSSTPRAACRLLLKKKKKRVLLADTKFGGQGTSGKDAAASQRLNIIADQKPDQTLFLSSAAHAKRLFTAKNALAPAKSWLD
jgi:hypothetical protein